jgi:uroporphyrin-III C-methyltransferase/precorrin-2 dehydrogenase/sirohydrochlorin ferrochelatase
MLERGTVTLVGAGPGDPDLLTVRAARALMMADVVLTDALVDPRVLELCHDEARILDVGKTPGGRSVPQDEINAMLLAEARAGHAVVRLKSGDPFVFGRGGEEAVYLAAHGIEVSVVPGLTSAVSVPALARVPLTHRGIATSFTVLTGTARALDPIETDALEQQWIAAAKTGGTLVFLMAMHVLDRVVARVLEGGLSGSTPVAVIQNGTHEDERVLRSELWCVVDDVRAARMGPPAVVVIGDVVQALAHDTTSDAPAAVHRERVDVRL